MNREKERLKITKPIVVFCLALVLIILMSCSKSSPSKNAVNVNKNHATKIVSSEHKQEEINFENTVTENRSDNNYSQDKTFEDIKKSEYSFDESEDLSNVKNTYYGKYNLHGEDVLGTFEVTRNSIVFTPDNGHSKEVIHFSGMKNVDRVEYPNGKVDLSLEFDGYEKVIKNVNDAMFSDILLYTTK